MSGEDVVGVVLIVFLVLLGLFLLPGILWMIWQFICGTVHFVIGFFAFLGKLYDMFLEAFPALLVFIFPAFFLFLARGGK